MNETAEINVRVNKYRGYCPYCNAPVAPYAGTLIRKDTRGRKDGKWAPAHLSCASNGSAQVNVISFSSGATFTRNTRGRCEDAPCCGCCTI